MSEIQIVLVGVLIYVTTSFGSAAIWVAAVEISRWRNRRRITKEEL